MATQQVSSGEQHQAAQSAIADSLALVLVRAAWPEFDPTRIQATLPRFAALVAALIHRYGQASATQAVQYYRQERAAAGVPGRVTIKPAPTPQVAEVEAQLKWATSDLYGQVTPEKLDAAQTKVVGVAEKLALNVGRDTLIDAVKSDRQAKGWARVPEPGACSFCLLLATRGAVYKSQDSGSFQAHDHCRCHVEPLFGAHYEPTAQVRAAQALYEDTPYGKNAATARNNFRVALQRERDAGNPRF